ncbi:MAG: hypothetical protein U5L96_11335 [Owenweeksia sp.]|nr:hypothetical protein [Owenweeksia sp.]
MVALLVLGAAEANFENSHTGPWLVSGLIAPLFADFSQQTLVIIERTAWWVHIVGILLFLNYLPISKHFHIILAFPMYGTAKLQPKGNLPIWPA